MKLRKNAFPLSMLVERSCLPAQAKDEGTAKTLVPLRTDPLEKEQNNASSPPPPLYKAIAMRNDIIQQYLTSHQALRREKSTLESRLARINQALAGRIMISAARNATALIAP